MWCALNRIKYCYIFLQTDVCGSLYDFLRRYKDAENKCLSECLIRAPSRRSLPSYYDVVSHPIDLMKIQVTISIESIWPSLSLLFSLSPLSFNIISCYSEHVLTCPHTLDSLYIYMLHAAISLTTTLYLYVTLYMLFLNNPPTQLQPFFSHHYLHVSHAYIYSMRH